MIEKLAIIALPCIYLLTFIVRNIMVRQRIGQPVKAKDHLLLASIILSSSCFIITIASTTESFYRVIGGIYTLRSFALTVFGLVLFAVSIVLGWVISGQMRDSWRVGVQKDQKTTLIKDGIYAYVRNPYFLTYFVMYFSLFLMRPSLILLMLILLTIGLFHRMVLNEEKYLLSIHGEVYEQYRLSAGRYFPRF